MKFHSRLTLDDKKDFISALRDYYNEPNTPYNKEHLWNTFTIYFNFLKGYADPRLTQVNQRQWEAYEMSVKQSESLWHRTRRGGKTIGMSVLEVFWAIIEFGIYNGAGAHRAPHQDQLKQFKKWLRLSPFFVKDRERQDKEIDLLDSEPLNLACVSGASSSGLGVSFLYEDEMGTVPIYSAINDYLLDTRAFILEGEEEQKRHFHASTGRVNTIFENDYLYLYNKQNLDHITYVHIMPWWECEWISATYIAKEKAKNFNNEWWVDEQYGCQWVNKTGSFFDKDNYVILGQDPKYPLTYFQDNNIIITSGGLDWNGVGTGHIMELGHWDYENSIIYLMKEKVFDKTRAIHDWIQDNPLVSVEVEGKPKRDGYNAGFNQHLKELGTNCIFQKWNRTPKDRRLAILQNSFTIIDPSCRWAVKNWKGVTFDLSSKDSKLLKRNDQHGLDGTLHLVHTKHKNIDTYGGKQKDLLNNYINTNLLTYKQDQYFNY